MTPHEAVLNFIEMLNAGYPAWRRAAVTTSEHEQVLLDEAFFDWAQSSWELVVERPLCGPKEFLDIYGAGSDYERQSHSRVFFHEARPTHEIACQSVRTGTVKDLLSGDDFVPEECTLDRFVCRKGAWFEDAPPFDYVLLERGDKSFLVPVADVVFAMRRL